MRSKNQKDFWAGIMVIAFGMIFVGFGTQYKFGTSAKMGPGYFPSVVGAISTLLGIIISASALTSRAIEEKFPIFYWRTLLLILGPVVLFGLLLRPLGLILCLFMLVIVSSYASGEFRWKYTLMNAAVLILLCIVLFVWGLKLPFQLWAFFLGN